MQFYDQIMLADSERERQMENMIATVRNMGMADIPILGYHWMPNGVWRTSRETRLRGGAVSNEFQYEPVKDAPFTHGRLYTAKEMWVNLC
ncbi:MAG: hypothetical protein JWL77_3113 [Chthonomonadaceae bacterium]|nr:hypothetical protein [Chthonomonadaceae bacterium]